MALVKRAFKKYGYFCASRPWEILTTMVTAVICVLTMYRQPLSATGHTRGAFQEKDYLGAGMLAMTIMRCASILYCYRQMKSLNKMGSRYVPAIAGVFAMYCSVLLSTMLVKCFGVDLGDLRDALFVFVFLLDINRASLLAQYSLLANSFTEIRRQIGEGMGILGPEITLDTLVEVLVIGVGTLSGVRKLELLCYFACVSVLIRYVVFLTFFPALLSLFLELSQCHERPATEQFLTLKKLFSDDTSKPNAVVERVKLIMSLGLSAVHLCSRWGGETPKLFGSSPGEDIFGFGSTGSGQELEFPFTFLRWLSANAEPFVLLTLLGTLIAKSVLGESGVEEFRLALLNAEKNRAERDVKITRVSSCGSVSPRVPDLRHCRSSSCIQRDDMSLAFCVPRKCGDLKSPNSEDSVRDLLSGRSRSVSTSSNVTFVVGDASSGSSGNASDEETDGTSDIATQTEDVVAPSICVEEGKAGERTVGGFSVNRPDDDVVEIRPMDELLRLLGSNEGGGPECLSDAEVLRLVKAKHIAPYQLETALNDPLRGVHIRRKIYKASMTTASADALDSVPFMVGDHDQAVGACCENVIGFVRLPLGLVGPLMVDGKPVYVPMATTEGCLVASTSRGARAIRAASETTHTGNHWFEDSGPRIDYKGGVRTSVNYDGMSRGPVVRFPSAMSASECLRWLETIEGQEYMKEAFDATSRFARLKQLTSKVAGRLMFLRFVAKTGDAMGMNMVSKGCEEALKMLNKKFPLMEVLAVSGNYCADKKPAAVNWVDGRGRAVVCEARIPGSVVKQVLKTNVESLVDLNIAKNLVGSAMAGSIGGFNAHAANIVSAIFIACGQDPAQVISSANCLTLMEKCGPHGEDLYMSVMMPSLELGTVGGGTILPIQGSCLRMMGVQGPGEEAGANAHKFASIVGATVLAGELSLLAALSAGHLVRSHLKHNRSSVFMAAPSQSAPSLPKLKPKGELDPVEKGESQDSGVK